MEINEIHPAIRTLRRECRGFRTPYVTEVSFKKDPFRVLVSCILSLRTKDQVTREASTRVFRLARNPGELSHLNVRTIEKAIYPVGFYHVKARVLKGLSKELVGKYSSRVPDTVEGLLKLKGVGRKTANLVVTMGYGKPGICVDTHVHRIVNRWGFVSTKTPHQTEFALRDKLPERYWIELNDLLVCWGQNICTPVSPFCTRCAIARYCGKSGVTRHR